MAVGLRMRFQSSKWFGKIGFEGEVGLELGGVDSSNSWQVPSLFTNPPARANGDDTRSKKTCRQSERKNRRPGFFCSGLSNANQIVGF